MTGSLVFNQNTSGYCASANMAEATSACSNTARFLRILDAIILASILFVVNLCTISLIVSVLLVVSVLLATLLITKKSKYAKDA